MYILFSQFIMKISTWLFRNTEIHLSIIYNEQFCDI